MIDKLKLDIPLGYALVPEKNSSLTAHCSLCYFRDYDCEKFVACSYKTKRKDSESVIYKLVKLNNPKDEAIESHQKESSFLKGLILSDEANMCFSEIFSGLEEKLVCQEKRIRSLEETKHTLVSLIKLANQYMQDDS